MLSTTRSQKQFFSEATGKSKSKSASPTLRKINKKQQEEKRVQSSPSERGTEKLSVNEIVSSCLLFNLHKLKSLHAVGFFDRSVIIVYEQAKQGLLALNSILKS